MHVLRTLLPCALALTLCLGATAPARAQTSPGVPNEAAQRAQLHDQSIAAGVLYVSSIVLGTWGLVGGIDVIGSAGAAYCRTCDHTVEGAIVISAIGSTLLMGLTLFIAIMLNVDHATRLRALDRETGRVTLAPGPGDVGLALTLALDGL